MHTKISYSSGVDGTINHELNLESIEVAQSKEVASIASNASCDACPVHVCVGETTGLRARGSYG